MNKYFIDQINVSDNEYKVIDLKNVTNINKGDLIFSYESSKVSFDVLSEESGYIYFNPNIKINLQYKVGTLVALTSDDPLTTNDLENYFLSDVIVNNNISLNENNRITKKAQVLIDKYNIDPSLFKDATVITEEFIQNLITQKKFINDFQDISFYYSNKAKNIFINKPKKLAIIGAGKAALQLLDAVLSSNTHTPVVIYDDNKSLNNECLLDIKINSNINPLNIAEDFNNGLFDEIIVSFSGDITNREKIFNDLMLLNIPFANIIHKSAIIGNYTTLGVGNLIFANTRIGPYSVIGNNNVISSYCNIEHHNSIGSSNTFGPTVVFSGSCTVGNQNRFGTGIFIEPNVTIGSNCIISSGLIIVTNIPNKKLLRNTNKIEIKDI
jgi:acetyltransferase-like isoleucine patch superfamily enzyme